MNPSWLGALRGRHGAIAWPPGIVVEADLPYGRRPAQRLDLYRPAEGRGPWPVLVLVHGGAWALGDKAQPEFIEAKVRHWVPRGWVVVAVDYRLLPVAGPLQQAEDVAQAVAVVQRRVERWGGDGERVWLLGHSTGAHLVALVLADASIGRPFGMARPQGAVLVDSAALDVVQVMEGEPLPLHERAFGRDPEGWRAASPWHRLQAPPPPLLMPCSSLRPASVLQNEHFADRVRGLGGTASVMPLPLSHAQLNQQLGTPGDLTAAVDAFLANPGG
ncbi:MAG: alpha/beta hydrolase [Rubrivivax sp.]